MSMTPSADEDAHAYKTVALHSLRDNAADSSCLLLPHECNSR